jgi:linoleoyl-CoA desaturase
MPDGHAPASEPSPRAGFRKISFVGAHERPFHDEVSRRVEAYFGERGLSKHGDWRIAAKTAVVGSLLVGLWAAIVFGGFGALASLALCLALGVVIANIGFNIGHDAIHGATTGTPWKNKLLSMGFDLCGAASITWSTAHNFVHHTYTNIPGVDHDLDPGPVMHFRQTANPGLIYRLQHVYCFFLYGFTTVVWLFKKDFVQIFSPDPRTGKRAPLADVLRVLRAKLLYAVAFVALPAVFIDRPWWQLVIGMFAMHFAAGFSLAFIFQLAHVVEGTEFPEVDGSHKLDGGWAAHQMRTTANFGGSNPLLTALFGGLDHQIEHHLFPKICHVHYPALSPIVRACAHEYGLPYIEHRTFWGAVRSHVRMMHRFGRPARG